MARILIVDDNEDIRLLLQMVLETEGHEVATAASGRHALGRDDLDTFDLVLLDVQMPEVDGWHTLEAIRARYGNRPAAAFCTVKSQPVDLVRGFELGADGYLRKPFDLTDLRTMIAMLLSLTLEERLAVRQRQLDDARALQQAVTQPSSS